jgi:hypothetical protein
LFRENALNNRLLDEKISSWAFQKSKSKPTENQGFLLLTGKESGSFEFGGSDDSLKVGLTAVTTQIGLFIQKKSLSHGLVAIVKRAQIIPIDLIGDMRTFFIMNFKIALIVWLSG